MLGQALYEKIRQEVNVVVTVARTNSNYEVDFLTDVEKIVDIIKSEKPNIVINSAAIINLKECEEYPCKAFLVNAHLPNLIEKACRETGSYIVQISTDHYYIEDIDRQHTETDCVTLLNEYAKSKFFGEKYVLNYENSLVVRTNIVGYRNKKNEPTFIEWVLESLLANKTITGFDDFYTSSIDVYHFTEILLELIEKKEKGIINIASTDVLSKYEFIYRFAKILGKENFVLKGKINHQIQEVKRANSLGLDVSKLKGLLEKNKIPSSQEVIHKLAEKYKEGAFYEL